MPTTTPALTRHAAYASLDVETNGNNPCQYSLLSIGIALFCQNSLTPVATFYSTISPVHDSVEPKCKLFWDSHPDSWLELQRDPVSIHVCMSNLSTWLYAQSLKYDVKWVASPANFDWMFLKCNYELYGPTTKFDIGFFCHDLSSLLRAYLIANNIRNKQAFIDRLVPHPRSIHHALDDATYQGRLYMQLRTLLSRMRRNHR
jgi:hypothetical protein